VMDDVLLDHRGTSLHDLEGLNVGLLQ
jgi:hypothetical protein